MDPITKFTASQAMFFSASEWEFYVVGSVFVFCLGVVGYFMSIAIFRNSKRSQFPAWMFVTSIVLSFLLPIGGFTYASIRLPEWVWDAGKAINSGYRLAYRSHESCLNSAAQSSALQENTIYTFKAYEMRVEACNAENSKRISEIRNIKASLLNSSMSMAEIDREMNKVLAQKTAP